MLKQKGDGGRSSAFSLMRLSAGLGQQEKHLHIIIDMSVMVNDWVEIKLLKM